MASRSFFSSGSRTVVSVAATAAAVVSGAAFGGPTAFQVIWDASQDGNGPIVYDWTVTGDAPVYGTYSLPGDTQSWTGWLYQGSASDPNGEWTLSWTSIFDTPGTAQAGGGAFVATNIVVTNNFPGTENFQLQFILPLDQAIVSPLIRGAIDGSVTDLTFDSATVLAPVGSQIYTPLIDSIGETTGFLLSDPYSVTAGFLGNALVGPADFGLESPLAAAEPVADTSIGILLNFDLTAGDSVSLNAFFELLPLPAPAGLPLLAAGALACRGRRRRDRSLD